LRYCIENEKSVAVDNSSLMVKRRDIKKWKPTYIITFIQ